MSVDIILPSSRRPHTIRYAIQSALAQTYSDFILHVVCDGCDAATESVVRSFDDPRVRFHRFPKGMGFGYGHRNTVMKQSDGDFVAYMADDDMWFGDHLERGLAELRARELDLVAFRSIQVRFPDTLDPYVFAFDWRLGPPSIWMRNWFMGMINCVHRRSVFDVLGYWDDRLFRWGDRDFYNRARTSPLVRSAYVDRATILRFFAQSWDGRYDAVAEPPQARYVDKLADAQWREAINQALSARRDWRVRRAQLADFVAFAVQGVPKVVRFLLHRLRYDRLQP